MRDLWLKLLWWQFRGRILRSARLVRRQPKYALGTLAGIAYFGWLFLRPSFSDGSAEFGTKVFDGPAQDLVHNILALIMALYVGASWLLMPSGKSLRLKAAELHFLLPAPLTSKQVITYALLKRLPATLITGLAIGAFLAEGNLLHRMLQGVFLVVFFLFWDYHGKTRNIYKPRLTRTWTGKLLVYGIAAALTAAALERGRELFMVIRRAVGSIEWQENGFSSVLDTFPPLANDFPGWLLKPFYFLSGFRFSEDTASAMVSFLSCIVLCAVLFQIIVASRFQFSENTVEEPKSSKTSRKRGRMGIKSREREFIPLPNKGGAQWVLLWKDLLLTTRVPLSWLMWGTLGLAVILSLFLHWLPENVRLMCEAAGMIAAAAFPILAGLAWKNGFRRDLFHLEAVRTWPVSPARMVFGELLGAAVLSSLLALSGLVVILACEFSAIIFGSGEGVLPTGAASKFGVSPAVFLILTVLAAAPLIVTIATLSSALASVTSLALPGWFMVSEEQKGDPAAVGQRLLIGIGLGICILMALIPTALLIFGVVFLQRKVFGTLPLGSSRSSDWRPQFHWPSRSCSWCAWAPPCGNEWTRRKRCWKA